MKIAGILLIGIAALIGVLCVIEFFENPSYFLESRGYLLEMAIAVTILLFGISFWRHKPKSCFL
jgi:hypothetical protein